MEHTETFRTRIKNELETGKPAREMKFINEINDILYEAGFPKLNSNSFHHFELTTGGLVCYGGFMPIPMHIFIIPDEFLGAFEPVEAVEKYVEKTGKYGFTYA